MEHIHVQGAPNYYECQEGILERLEDLLLRYSFEKGIVIHGEKSWAVTQPFFPDIKHPALTFYRYQGECSEAEIRAAAEKATEAEADFVLGIGGGKVLDLAKAVGNHIQKDVVLIPTLAATCAAWTPLSVIYDQQGAFVKYTIFPRATLMVLIEPRILLNSPVNYLRAGIGDTLAKWYEARALTDHLSSIRVPVKVGLEGAKLCKDVLLQDGAQALDDLEHKRLSTAFLNVVETNILSGGIVGGFADAYGRIAGAHSIHNGLTRFQETHHLLHGEKVAYGILVQLALENDWDEINRLLPYYRELQLPYSLDMLGLSANNDMLLQLAEGALKPGESIHLMQNTFTEKDVVRAVQSLQSFIAAG